jgi:hypothetical protein
MNIKIYHADHGITETQQSYINAELETQPDGFFIRQVNLPDVLGVVPCGLHGPVMGDDPVPDSEVTLEVRGDRPYADRMVNRASRPVNYVQVIGVRAGNDLTLFTVYGGALAPQHPEDPTNEAIEAAKKFWSQHALANGTIKITQRWGYFPTAAVICGSPVEVRIVECATCGDTAESTYRRVRWYCPNSACEENQTRPFGGE